MGDGSVGDGDGVVVVVGVAVAVGGELKMRDCD